MPLGSNSAGAAALAAQPDGKLVITGFCYSGPNYHFCAVRLNSDGSFDTTFNVTGKLIQLIGSNDDQVAALAVQPDGRIVLAGACVNGAASNFCAVRLDGGPFGARACTLDLDGDGKVLATTDALISMRVALGLRGSAVVGGIVFPAGATRTDWPAIRAYLETQCGMTL